MSTPKSNRCTLYAESEALLPLEMGREVIALFEELRQELKPVGILEEDQVATIAKHLWRKHHLRSFHLAEQARAESYRERMFPKAGPSASPDKQLADALTYAYKKDKPLEEDEKWLERLADLADLRKLNLARYIQDLEMMERLDAGVERAVGRLQKYQTKRMTGSLSPPAVNHRAPRWGRVRQ
jgi:hypothetical protein